MNKNSEILRNSYPNRIRIIRELALQAGYAEICLQEANKMISFKKDGNRINIYYSTMTVATCLKHPVQGKTQLFRRNVGQKLLTEIFNNPRLHTGRGYQRKMTNAI
jgi:hypothetical protein